MVIWDIATSAIQCEIHNLARNTFKTLKITSETSQSVGQDATPLNAYLETVLFGDLFENVNEIESGCIKAAAVKRRQRFSRFPFYVLKELRHSLSSLIVQRLDLFSVLQEENRWKRRTKIFQPHARD